MKPTYKRQHRGISAGGKAKLSTYERSNIRHLTNQSRMAIVSLVLTATTTLALIYIAYLQYKTADSQVRLEYAKVAPIFFVRTSFFSTKRSVSVINEFPRSVEVKITRGDAKLSSISMAEDMRVTVSTGSGALNNAYTCIVRSEDYFMIRGDNSGADAQDTYTKVASHPIFSYPDKGTIFIISPIKTWVKLEYIDIFGNVRPVVFSGNASKLDQTLGDDFGTDGPYPLFKTSGNYRNSDFPAIWDRPMTAPLDKDCKVLSMSAIFKGL